MAVARLLNTLKQCFLSLVAHVLKLLHCSAVHCSAVQCSAVQCSAVLVECVNILRQIESQARFTQGSVTVEY